MARDVIDIGAPARRLEVQMPNEPVSIARQLRPRAERSSRWLALAILAGAIVALAFVGFLAR